MKDAIFWDIAMYSWYVNQHFRGMYHVHLQGSNSAEQETSVQHVMVIGDHSDRNSLSQISFRSMYFFPNATNVNTLLLNGINKNKLYKFGK
jgi:hypothetical protein